MANSSVADLELGIERRVQRARIRLAMRQPFLAAALMRLPFRAVKGVSVCPTMATDGYHIFYNPAWCDDLSDSQLRGVLAHELLHVIFDHSARLKGRQPKIWNQACDIAINLLLIEQGFDLPEGGLWDQDYRGMTAEEIYGALQATGRGCEMWSLSSHSSGTDDGELIDAGSDLLMPDDPAVVPLRDAECPDTQELVALQRELRRQASDQLQGRAAGQFRMECEAADESLVDWRAILRNWLFDRVRSDWSLYPFSKRHIHRGLMLPSPGVEAPGHIVFAIDTSGSMTDDALASVVAELRGFRETFPCELTVIQADAAIQDVQHYEALDDTPTPKRLTIKGRGGTDFRPVFAWIEEQVEIHRPVTIYATDGYGSFPARPPEMPVIWLITQGGISSDKIPFGFSAKMP
jgi:predicted metal-dependent peptidase